MSVFSGVGSPGTTGPASGGKIYAYNNISTTPQMVAPQRAARTSVTFHNPGTVDIFIAPISVQNTNSDVTLSPTTSLLGGCVRIFANGGSWTVSGECQKPWQAFALSGTTNALTVIDTNV